MAKWFTIFLLVSICTVKSQITPKSSPLDFSGVAELFADDYMNLYLYKSADFSFTKYDSLGFIIGKLQFTLPFKIQSVQNPLRIAAFSENAQEIKFYDQNLAEIKTVNLRLKFGHIKQAYVEDMENIWVLDESSKQLFQYNLREERTINSYSMQLDYDGLIDVLVHDKKVYLLYKDALIIHTLTGSLIKKLMIDEGRRLRRENNKILVINRSTVMDVTDNEIKTIFKKDEAQIVDKNSRAFFVISGNKLYLYPIEKKKGVQGGFQQ